MLLLGLLLAALACLVLGLVLASAPWLIASLVASVVAGAALWRYRERLADRAGTLAAPPAPAARQTALVTGTAFQGSAVAAAAGSGPAGAAPERTSVWVVDARPDYHGAGCPAAGADAEEIPRAQAVEDGFTPCPVCTPDQGEPATDRPATDRPAPDRPAPVAGPDAEVWVVDGRPRYHAQGCLIIEGQSAEPISRAEAARDGFMACSMCEPDVSRGPARRAGGDEPR